MAIDSQPDPVDDRPVRRLGGVPVLALGGLAVALCVLFLLVDMRAVGAALVDAEPGWVALAGALALNASFIVAVKLWAIVRIVDQPRTLRETWSAVMAGVSLNAVIPGRGGDLVRAVFLARDRSTVALFLGAVLVERLMDLFSLGLLVAVLSSTVDGITLVAFGVMAAAVLGTVALATLGPRMPWRPELGARVARTASHVARRPGYALFALGLSFLSWMNNAAALVVCLRAVGVEAPWLATYRAAAVGVLAGIVPVSVSGIGTRDTVLVLTLAPYGQDVLVAAGSMLFTVTMFWFLALVGTGALGVETLATIRRSVRLERNG